MDPVSIGSGLFGVASGVASSIIGSHNASMNYAQQAKENELNRAHNLKLAQLQNKWNMEMYDKNNEYNSPVEQRKRMQAAGLNPDLMYGGTGSLVPAQTPAMTAGEGSHSSITPGYAPYDPSSGIGAVADNALKMAQVGLIKAQTKKTEGESSIVWSDAKIRDAFNQGQLDLQGVQIRLSESQIDLTDEQIRKIQPEIDNLQSSTDNLRQKIDESKAVVASLGEDVIYKRFQNYFASDMFKAQLRQLSASSGLSEAQTKETLFLMGSKLLNLNADTAVKVAQKFHFNASVRNLDADTGIKVSNGVIAAIDSANARLDFDIMNTSLFGTNVRTIDSWTRVLSGLVGNFTSPVSNYVDDKSSKARSLVGVVK